MYIQSHYERKIRSLESRIDFLEHEVKYISDFITWIDSEPPVWKLFAWVKWKKNKPERMCYND